MGRIPQILFRPLLSPRPHGLGWKKRPFRPRHTVDTGHLLTPCLRFHALHFGQSFSRLGNNIPISSRRVGHVFNVPESCVLKTGHAPKMVTHRHVGNVPPQLTTRQVISRQALTRSRTGLIGLSTSPEIATIRNEYGDILIIHLLYFIVAILT